MANATGKDHPQTEVYRAYSRDRTLLYVGVSDNTRRRLKSHWRSRWIEQAVTVEVAVFATRVAALAEEARLIAESKPKHNIRPEPLRPAHQEPAVDGYTLTFDPYTGWGRSVPSEVV